ncbi:large ribosomal subunit protein eL29-like [Glossophaga mutica]
MQTNNAKAMSTRAEAIKALVKPKEVKPRSQRAAVKSLINLPASLTPLGNVLMQHRQGPRALAKTQIQAQAQAQAAAPVQAPLQARNGAQVPTKAPE